MINEEKMLICIKCGNVSMQKIIVNNGNNNQNIKMQKCPYCGYEAKDISEFVRQPKIDNGIKLFEEYSGGFFEPSSSCTIFKEDDKYKFIYSTSVTNGVAPTPTIINEQNEEYYQEFIKKILDIVKDWKSSYTNDILDGTQWHLEINEYGKKYYGSNEFPDNYQELGNLLKLYFNIDNPRPFLYGIESDYESTVFEICLMKGFGFSGCCYINKMNNSYYFKSELVNGYGIGKTKNIRTLIKNEDEYNTFMNSINNVITTWQDSYSDFDNNKNFSWHLYIKETQRDYKGFNLLPPEYEKIIKLLDKYFDINKENLTLLIKDIK